MNDISLLYIALVYLAVINVVTFFVYGIDKAASKRGQSQTRLSYAEREQARPKVKWKAKKSKWRVSEATLLGLAIFFLCSCGTASPSSLSSSQTAQKDISTVADKVWAFASSHPEGFTLDIRTMTEPKQGIAVSYAATQNSHTRSQLDAVIRHALQNDGYVGGWYNQKNGLYYFDSTRLFPEDSLHEAVQFGKDNKQTSVFILSTSSEVLLCSDSIKQKSETR
jgi:uncharacterized membrane protein YsdA (DUF1294 family)